MHISIQILMYNIRQYLDSWMHAWAWGRCDRRTRYNNIQILMYNINQILMYNNVQIMYNIIQILMYYIIQILYNIIQILMYNIIQILMFNRV
jgi:hypothetical protein